MPKIVKINSNDIDINGTCYAGTVNSSYTNIVNKLGSPTDSFDDYKSDAEWYVEFEGGIVATIYNWKNGKNYCGEDGLEIHEITEWHIGGSHMAVEWVDDYLNNSWPVFDDIRQEAQT